LDGAKCVGVTAGASAPEELVQGLLEHLRKLGADGPTERLKTAEENVIFHLPEVLRS